MVHNIKPLWHMFIAEMTVVETIEEFHTPGHMNSGYSYIGSTW